VIRRRAGRRRLNAIKSQPAQVQFIDDDIDHTNRVGLPDIIIQAFRQQDDLGSILALYETLHLRPPRMP
jgi:hypothetical protein